MTPERNPYPATWPVIAREIRVGRAEGRCECDGRCGWAPHDTPRCSRQARTVLNLDGDHANIQDANLLAVCVECRTMIEANDAALADPITANKKPETGAVSLFDDLDEVSEK